MTQDAEAPPSPRLQGKAWEAAWCAWYRVPPEKLGQYVDLMLQPPLPSFVVDVLKAYEAARQEETPAAVGAGLRLVAAIEGARHMLDNPDIARAMNLLRDSQA